MSLWRLFPFRSPKPSEARSVYFPVVPRAKIFAFQWADLPAELLHQLIQDCPRVLFPFLVEADGAPRSVAEFNEIALQMLNDREFVFHTPILIRREGSDKQIEDARVRLEYCVSGPLLRRIQRIINNPSDGEPTFYNFIVDLVMQATANSGNFDQRRDEFGYYWLRLRDVGPYRDHAFFKDVTILVRYVLEVVTVVIGETDDDIDVWNRYECMSNPAKDWLMMRNVASRPKSG